MIKILSKMPLADLYANQKRLKYRSGWVARADLLRNLYFGHVLCIDEEGN